MAKGTVLASDNFNRADGGLGANWTTITGMGNPQIVGNEVRTNAVGTDSKARWGVIEWPSNQYAQAAVITLGTTSTGTGAICRCAAAAASFYQIGLVRSLDASGKLVIIRYDAGAATVLSDVTKTLATNDIGRLEVEGATLRGYINDVLQYGPTTDSTYANGYAGIHVYADVGTVADAEVDNWEAGTLLVSKLHITKVRPAPFKPGIAR